MLSKVYFRTLLQRYRTRGMVKRSYFRMGLLLILVLAVPQKGSAQKGIKDDIVTPSVVGTNDKVRTIWEVMKAYQGGDFNMHLMNNSFAVGWIEVIGGSACSGTMISPHIFMTAAHCGITEWTANVSFFRIDEDATDPGSAGSYAYSQPYYARGMAWAQFGRGDTGLYWLEDGTDGIPPGVKYGYVELSTEPTQVNDNAYSLWGNPVDNFNGHRLGPIVLYSSGHATRKFDYDPQGGWFGPGTDWDIYGAPGASGSAVFGVGRSNHQIIGVTSSASTPEGSFRGTANTENFLRIYDADKNSVLDAIEYDWIASEYASDFHILNFSTPLQRSLWRRGEAATRPELAGKVGVTDEPGFWVGKLVGMTGRDRNDGLWHSGARLLPNATYDISMVVQGIQSDATTPYLAFHSDKGNSDIQLNFSPTIGQARRLTTRVKLGNYDDYRMIFGEGRGGSYYVSEVSHLRESSGTGLSFESGYERRTWEYAGKSYVSSWGINGQADFSGVVVGTPPQGWGLRNRHIALEADAEYTISFKVKHLAGRLGLQDYFIEIEDLGGSVVHTSSWNFSTSGESKTVTVKVKNNSNQANVVTFGCSDSSCKYIIDDIQATKSAAAARTVLLPSVFR